MSPQNDIPARMVLLGASLLLWTPYVDAAETEDRARETRIRAGTGRTIVAVNRPPRAAVGHISGTAVPYPYPRPRLAGFSPLIAITTSNERRPSSDETFEHDLRSSYAGSPLNAPASDNFVIGFLDSGADVDLVAGSSAETLGLTGSYLTENTIGLGGVGEGMIANISWPIGFFAASLSAIDPSGTLDLGAVVGHTNVATVVTPPIDCGTGEVVTAIAGMPLIAFHDTVIHVDIPQTVTVGGQTFSGPDVQLHGLLDPLPEFVAHTITMEFAGAIPLVATANYYPAELDPLAENPYPPDAPSRPTGLSVVPGFWPTFGRFLATVLVLEGEPGPTNPAQEIHVLVDTGAQSSIISEGVAANLSLPFEPDFTVDICGIGGLVTGIPGYYVDYVRINAMGGAIEFSRAPFVVLNVELPEGGVIDGILGMNFFWNRNVMFEPAWGELGLSSGFFHVSDPVPFAYGDFDLDFDVDPGDEATFVSCATGPAAGLLTVDCDHIDQDLDGDVDLRDFGRFQVCHTDFDVPADPTCGE